MTIEATEDRIARFQKLALEARTLASEIQHGRSRDMMLEVAETWERLAQLEATDLERKTARS